MGSACGSTSRAALSTELVVVPRPKPPSPPTRMTTPITWKLYCHPQHRWRVHYPGDWMQVSKSYGGRLETEFISGHTDTHSAALIIMTMNDNNDLLGAFESDIRRIPGFVMAERTVLNQHEAVRYVIIRDDLHQEGYVLYGPVAHSTISIGCKAKSAFWGSCTADFERIQNSFAGW